MNCEEVEQNDTLGGYIAGTLLEAERDRFEEHFFGCDHCLELVEAARLARAALMAAPPEKQRSSRRFWIPLLAAAAAMVFAIGIWKNATPKRQAAVEGPAVPKPAPAYELLARFDPPVYRPDTLRGSGGPARAFRDAMKLYSTGDYAAASGGLRAEIASSPGSVEARYYLGICELLSGDPTGGIAELGRVIAAGDTPFLSEARFYSAKAELAGNHVDAARAQLRTLVAEHSELAPQATEILRQLP